MNRLPAIPSSYPLREAYLGIVRKIRRLAPKGLDEVVGVIRRRGVPDFRLVHRGVRVIGVIANARHVTVYLPNEKVYAARETLGSDADFVAFEDAHGYLCSERPHYPWGIWSGTDIDDPMVDTYLECGMRLIVRVDQASGRRGAR